MNQAPTQPELFGIAAEYADDTALLEAARQARAAGYTAMEAYSPIPVHGLYEVMGGKRTILPLITLAGGILGLLAGYWLQIWVSAIEYPINVGGRPYITWGAFFPIGFACTILGAGLSTFVAMFAMNNFPEPYHPIFNTPNFEEATRDRYFLCIEATDPKFDRKAVHEFLSGTQAAAVSEVKT